MSENKTNRPWYLYIAQASTGLYYVGITTDPKRRLQDHNDGRGARLAKGQGPFKLRYISPKLPDQSTARKLEMQLKKWPRPKKEKLINQIISIETLTQKEQS